jgi:hypothetical protein
MGRRVSMQVALSGYVAAVGLSAVSLAPTAWAVDTTWSSAVSGDFYTNGNWDTGAAPGVNDNALLLNPAVTANINFAGTRDLGSIHLGTDGVTGGNVDFSAGTLNVAGSFDRSHVGDRGAADSKLIIRGSAVFNFGQPFAGGPGGAGYNNNGGNQDLEVGAQTGLTGNKGVIELHDNAVLRIGDDLKVGAEANGNGEVLIDGNARIYVGSGISVSESGPSAGIFTVGGTALVVSGNSAGAGLSNQGVTDEGYFTLSTNNGSTADVIIRDSGKVYARTLQMRGGVSNMTIQNNGEFHVFDTFNFAAPNLGVATVVGNPDSGFDPVRASHLAENTDSQVNILVTGNGKFSIDQAVDNGTGQILQGLAMGGGNNRGVINSTGGAANIELRDSASFVIQQNLYMTIANGFGSPVGASSQLRIVGPNVNAAINGNLYMSFNPVALTANADPSTLSAVITGATHSTIDVGGTANIEFGNLKVELSGYSPVGGETYTLLTAAAVTGADFLASDFSLATLASGLSWDVDVTPTSVVLKVLGSTGRPGDFDGDNDVDGADFLRWQRGQTSSPLSPAQLAAWKANFGIPATPVAGGVPEPTGVALAAAAVCGLITRRRRTM